MSDEYKPWITGKEFPNIEGHIEAYERIRIIDWIPCAERVPEDCRHVLVTLEYESGEREVAIGEYWDVDDPMEHGWGSFGLGTVIAWAEIPKPYGEKHG